MQTSARYIRELTWWLVHGAVRTGTTLMLRLIASEARLYVSDWGLGTLLQLTPLHPHVRFDRTRAYRDISGNILDNACPGGGFRLEMAFKQANLKPEEYPGLTMLWGPPQRIIFCFREPAGFMASALRKFPDYRPKALQKMYLEAVQAWDALGGDLFEYRPTCTEADYRRFLEPLRLKEPFPYPIRYAGSQAAEQTTEAMWAAYEYLCRQAARQNSSLEVLERRLPWPKKQAAPPVCLDERAESSSTSCGSG